MLAFLSEAARHPFLRYALAAGCLASVAAGVIGTYVTARRITYIAGGISHCVLAGLGAALYFQKVHGWAWFDPRLGATAAALFAAGIIAVVSLRGGEREDTAIGALWAVGMAGGILFMARTPGYGQDLMSYLFGNILMVSSGDIAMLCLLDLLVVGLAALFYNRFLAVCFDEEFARVRGIRVDAYYVLLLGLTALTVVALMSVVGIVMVIAMLTLPTAVAGMMTRVLWRQMIAASLLSALFTTAGLAASYGPDLPAGAVIVTLSGAAYLAALAGSALYRRWAARTATRGAGV